MPEVSDGDYAAPSEDTGMNSAADAYEYSRRSMVTASTAMSLAESAMASRIVNLIVCVLATRTKTAGAAPQLVDVVQRWMVIYHRRHTLN